MKPEDIEAAQNFLRRYKLSEQSRQALTTALESAKDHAGTEHVLHGLLQFDEVTSVLEALEVDLVRLKERTAYYLENDPNNPEVKNGFTPTVLDVLYHADLLRYLDRVSSISPLHLFISMLERKIGMGFLLLLGDNPPEDPMKLKIIKSELTQAVRAIIEEQKPE